MFSNCFATGPCQHTRLFRVKILFHKFLTRAYCAPRLLQNIGRVEKDEYLNFCISTCTNKWRRREKKKHDVNHDQSHPHK